MGKLLQEIYSLYNMDVYRYFYQLTRNPALSEDLTSEVFLEAVRSLPSFRGESDVKTWLYAIARHRWYHYLRSKNREPVTDCDYLEYLADDLNMEKDLTDKAVLDRIRELLQKEPERVRGIVKLRTEGFSYYEIGKAFHITENSARVIMFRLKNKLIQILKKEGYIDE